MGEFGFWGPPNWGRHVGVWRISAGTPAESGLRVFSSNFGDAGDLFRAASACSASGHRTHGRSELEPRRLSLSLWLFGRLRGRFGSGCAIGFLLPSCFVFAHFLLHFADSGQALGFLVGEPCGFFGAGQYNWPEHDHQLTAFCVAGCAAEQGTHHRDVFEQRNARL